MPGNEFAVCDSSNHRVQIFNLNGLYINSFGKYGTGKGEFNSCACVAYNRYKQQLIVSDRYNHRIQIFDMSGHYILEFGENGTDFGKFDNPWGIAIDELGLIYIVDKVYYFCFFLIINL